MNIIIDGLNKLREKLDSDYEKIEKDINKLYLKNNTKEALSKEQLQDMIDEQLNLLDTIICNLEKTPIMYKELMHINKKYKQVVGE